MSDSPFEYVCFNTQPPEGGWKYKCDKYFGVEVSTHSRPKAAGPKPVGHFLKTEVSTHSRPKAAGQRAHRRGAPPPSFNTQPPEGGWCNSAKI